MLKNCVLALCFGTVSVACAAQAAKTPLYEAQESQQRASVRAAVQTKLGDGTKTMSKNGTAHQLSPQEREELRRQLRQQNPP